MYIACGPVTKTKNKKKQTNKQKITERIRKFKETGYSRYIYETKLDNACFEHGMAHRDFKDLTRTTASDKILHDKVFIC